MNSQDSQRVGMQELRAIVAVHSGRVEVSGTACLLHGRGAHVALAVCHAGTVDRMLVNIWVRKVLHWDRQARVGPPFKKNDPAP